MADITKRISATDEVSYRVRVRVKGHPLKTATFASKTKAKEWAQVTEAAMKEGRSPVEASKRTVGELIDRYILEVLPSKPVSGPGQRSQLLWWKQQLGHLPLSQLSASSIVEKRDLLAQGETNRGGKRCPSTVVRYMAAFGHALNIARKEWEWLSDSPMSRVKRPREPRGRVRFLNDQERTSLLTACRESDNPYLYTIVVLALSTGMRYSEVVGLDWSAVDLPKGRIVLEHTKNGERRVVHVAAHALELLKGLYSKRSGDGGLLFPGKEPWRPVYLRNAWERAVAEAGVQNFHFHDLRHTAASYLAMQKATTGEIAEILGHKTLQMVKRYAHFSESHSARVVAKMNQHIFGPESGQEPAAE
ncbi:MAG: tyrosine-type recombinase/integrase [Chlamydiia bacterium]